MTADLEYVGYGGMKVYSAELGGSANQAFQTKYNGQISRNFEGALNIKVGSEIRVSPSLSIRGGAAMFGSGYAQSYDTIDRNAFQFSRGIGYRKSNLPRFNGYSAYAKGCVYTIYAKECSGL